MAFAVARTAHPSQSWSSIVTGIQRSVGGSLLSNVSQFRSFSVEVLDGRVPLSQSAADSLSGQLSRPVPPTPTVGAHRKASQRNANKLSQNTELRVYPPIVKVSSTSLTEDERPVRNQIRASRNVARESSRHFPRLDFASGTELLPSGSASGSGKIPLASATTKSRAIALLQNRQRQGLRVDSHTLIEVLKQCSEQRDQIATRQVHDYIIQSGMDKHPYVATTLLNAYIRCGKLPEARRVFDGIEKTHRTVITYNVMIGAYAKSGVGVEAYKLFLQMNPDGFMPNAITCLSILNASASVGALEWVKGVHCHALKAGLESDLRVGNALVHMYAKSGSINDARLVFNRMEKRDVVTWNSMIGAHAESGSGMEAYQLFLQMKQEGLKPTAITYMSILNASASVGALEWVEEVHSHALKEGLEGDVRLANALVHMYAKNGSIEDARRVFDRMKNRSVVTWNSMIGAYAECGQGMEAYGLFLQMKRQGFEANAITYMSILNAAASGGALEWVKAVHSHAVEDGLESDLRVGNALVHMYAKSGSIDEARLVFDRMEKLDVVTWTAMIGGLAQHGCGHEALNLFRKMNEDGVKPQEHTFVALLSACSHTGLVEDGRRLFAAMRQDYGVKPTVVHYTCMVDLLGRAGHLKEAKLLIENMPMEADAVIWTALLGACRTNCNEELGEFAAKEALKLDAKDAAVYVLLSNIYAAAGKWEKVFSMRGMMQKRGIRKEPGRSWIEVDDKVHEFVVGDASHPEAKAIYSVLQELTEKLKVKGYVPDTKLVLQNIDEEDKELALCSHSEKLAIAYGLLRVPHGKPIRVKKNLRVCSDCHAAIKLISEVAGREIIVRDANRFHHFRDGVCSCGDYW